MAVAFDAGSESHGGTSPSQSEDSFSWNHAGAATPKGVLVFVFTGADADYITSVTYGGENLAQVDEAIESGTEAGRCTAFFLGVGVPGGTQSVVVTRSNNATPMYGVAVTVTAGAGTETAGVVKLQGSQALSEQNVNDGSPGTNSLRVAAVTSGRGAVPPAGANSTDLHGMAYAIGSSRSFASVYETTPGQGSRPVGFSDGTSDECAALHLAIVEVATAVPFRRSLLGVGF